MTLKSSNDVMGYLTERYLRFKEQERKVPVCGLSDFDCGRMHQIVCTLSEMTGVPVTEVRKTLDTLAKA